MPIPSKASTIITSRTCGTASPWGAGAASKSGAPSFQTLRTTALLMTVYCVPTKTLGTSPVPVTEASGNGRKTRITDIQVLTSSHFRHTLALIPSAIVTKHPSFAIPSSGALIPLLTRAP
ncbi:hypothetical protein CKAH01_15615 [Colletotrichum kahawae]|uniref:Uncharacterized protein n=1 Tax=Colletotrichum kahawae TaxID=34407 RepID=A0AAE0D6M5_COLKA|nr:hypothetical protein CKAH01_15615 [Colletotrichum kahawae]